MKQITTVFEELDKDMSLIEIENGINKLMVPMFLLMNILSNVSTMFSPIYIQWLFVFYLLVILLKDGLQLQLYYFLRRKEMLYLTTLSTHSIYGYMASDIW